MAASQATVPSLVIEIPISLGLRPSTGADAAVRTLDDTSRTVLLPVKIPAVVLAVPVALLVDTALSELMKPRVALMLSTRPDATDATPAELRAMVIETGEASTAETATVTPGSS